MKKQCKKCGEWFSSVEGLINHIKSAHGLTKPRKRPKPLEVTNRDPKDFTTR